jgi:hypothetical protein
MEVMHLICAFKAEWTLFRERKGRWIFKTETPTWTKGKSAWHFCKELPCFWPMLWLLKDIIRFSTATTSYIFI